MKWKENYHWLMLIPSLLFGGVVCYIIIMNMIPVDESKEISVMLECPEIINLDNQSVYNIQFLFDRIEFNTHIWKCVSIECITNCEVEHITTTSHCNETRYVMINKEYRLCSRCDYVDWDWVCPV